LVDNGEHFEWGVFRIDPKAEGRIFKVDFNFNNLFKNNALFSIFYRFGLHLLKLDVRRLGN
jgi:hypothetical protein